MITKRATRGLAKSTQRRVDRDQPRRLAVAKRAAAPIVSRQRELRMPATPSVSNLKELREAAAACISCPLYQRATQTVFGEGPAKARIVLIGEQPGDQEDQTGRPFVGPAGKLLDRALADAGIERAQCYVSNAVKHFKWEPRGKRRLHAKPGAREIAACRPWMDGELGLIQPDVLICLGATATSYVFGAAMKVQRDRGKILSSPFAPATLVTVHPSSLLRQIDEASRKREYRRFVADLRVAAKRLK